MKFEYEVHDEFMVLASVKPTPQFIVGFCDHPVYILSNRFSGFV
jgi:hypothetical protein